MLASGPEWSIGSLGPGPAESGGITPDAGVGGAGTFGDALAGQIGKLEGLQQGAAQAARDLATGAATDPSAAIVAVDRARLAMQLASQLRTEGLEAFNDVFHTQV
jgi:flagellar hook-basal body complex protein FliE